MARTKTDHQPASRKREQYQATAHRWFKSASDRAMKIGVVDASTVPRGGKQLRLFDYLKVKGLWSHFL